MKYKSSIIIISIAILIVSNFNNQCIAQDYSNQFYFSGTARIDGNDTIPIFWFYEVPIFGRHKRTPEQQAAYNRLRYNVTKVYPYAITAAYVLQDVDDQLAARRTNREKKDYLKSKENEMKAKFKDQLKDLTMTQGLILVKLINRQTGRDCYDIIKEIKGGFNARISQTAASLFNNNLKAQYDPYGEDSQIEAIVQEIESNNYYQYQTRGNATTSR